MRPADIADLLKALAIDVREYIAQALAPLEQKHAELQERVAALPTVALKGEQGDPGPPGLDAFKLALSHGFTGTEAEWLESLRGPPGESIKGEDGKSVTIDDVAPVLSHLVKKAVDDLPPAQDGKSITVDDVTPLLRELVADAVAALPPAKDGADGASVSLDDVQPLIDKAVAALPAPKDGTSVTVDDLRPLVEAVVQRAVEDSVATLPQPQELTPDFVKPIVYELVDKAVAGIPAAIDDELEALLEAVTAKFANASCHAE